MEETSPPTKPRTNFKQILTESNLLIKSNQGVFYSLAALFLLPLAAAAVLYRAILYPSFQSLPASAANHATTVLLSLAFFISSLVLSTSAVGSISYAALRGLSGEKPTLPAAVKSLSSSFFPLLATVLLTQLIISATSLVYASLIISLWIFGHIDVDAQTIPSLYTIVMLTAVFLVLLMYIQVNWSLAFPVAVFESARGFEALRRSKELIHGKRWLALSLNMAFGFYYLMAIQFISKTSPRLLKSLDGTTSPDYRRNNLMIDAVMVFFNVVFLSLLQLYSIVANTVLYSCCRTSEHGGDDYLSLPVNDQNFSSLA